MTEIARKLDRYRDEIVKLGAAFNASPPATDDQLNALAVHVGLGDWTDLPSELVDWFRWAGGVGFPRAFFDVFSGSTVRADANSSWSVGVEGLEQVQAVGDPDMEAIGLLKMDSCEVAVSTRDSDAGSLWLRDIQDNRYGLLWNSIDEMLDCLLALVSNGHLGVDEHDHLVLINRTNATVPLPTVLKQSFYQDWPA